MKLTMSIYFPKEKKYLAEKLEQVAKEQDRSVNYIVVKAIEEYLKHEG